ncbi:hypothetical protein H6G96_37530 [Nostoc sp. FACHB-892]|uniref:hypothetical protein n=1 Tax=Nostoc sp. FACHB-892 TaxID=2692843 RepID=UPI0016850A8A|nr:hypothetical protein [Nostoc sp. FACHB-892]MBD2731827.1 hypothetical protein [Nostoc sp. FACHB-892]
MAKWDEVGQELVKKLGSVKKESTIQKLAVAVVEQIRESYEKPNSRKTPLSEVRKAVLEAFPDTETQEHPWQYFTNKGKGNIERYQHLALKYLTLSTEEWDVVGNEARQQWKAQQQVEESEQQLKPETQLEKQPKSQTKKKSQTVKSTEKEITLNDMNISQLQLDADTQAVVEAAIAHSGISLADFVRKACQVYAKTITGKVKQFSEDLTAVSTEELKSDTYKTHPGRAEELTRRAIYALEIHNNNCTEKSQKWMITQTAIQSLTGSKPATIKAILENYKTRLDDHNAKHELNAYDNRKGGGRQIENEIDLAVLVPDGLNLN